MALSSRWQQCNNLRIRDRLHGILHNIGFFFCALHVFRAISFQIKTVMWLKLPLEIKIFLWFLWLGLFCDRRIWLNANGRGNTLNKKLSNIFFECELARIAWRVIFCKIPIIRLHWHYRITSFKFIKQVYGLNFPMFDGELRFDSIWV